MAYNAGAAFLEIIPSFRNFERTLGRDVRKLGKSFGSTLSEEFTNAFDKALADSLQKAAASKVTSPVGQSVDKDGDRSANELLAKIREAIQKGWEEGSEKGSKSAEAKAEASAKKIRETQEREAKKATLAAEREAKKLATTQEREAKRAADTLQRELVRAQREAAKETERIFNQSWAGRIARGLASAMEKLPDLSGKIAPDGLAEDISHIRAELQSLRDVEVGVDLDEGEFQARLQQVLNAIREVNGKTASVEVEANTAGALKEMYAVLALAGIIDRRNPDLKVKANTSGARREMGLFESAVNVNLSRLQNLVALGASLGLAIIPAAAAAASAIGFIGTAALAAVSGLGVLALGFSGIAEAVKALNQQSLDAEKTTKSLGKAAIGIANAQDSVASAERSLAAARLNAADEARKAAQAVRQAEEQLGDARLQAARDAVDAALRVQDAQRDLSRAEKDAMQARMDLTESYKDALDAYEDLTSSIKANALSERQSILDVAEAKADLDKVLANPRATEAQREQARITYEREVNQLEDVRRRRGRLAEDLAEADRKGIEGSDQVTSAREKLASAEDKVASAARTLGAALQAQSDQRLASARAVRDAEIQLSEARLAQDRQARQSADALASASQALVSAQRQLESAYLTSAAAGGEAFENLNESMAALSPTAQGFARFIFGLKDEFLQLRAAASDGMLSGAQTAIENLLPSFDGLLGFVTDVSNGLGELFIRMSEDLQNTTFGKFFDYLKASAVPSLNQIYEITSNLAQGFINLFLAFTPFSDEVGTGLVDLTERFRVWSETLDTNQGFQRFLDYVRDNAPKVWELVKEGTRFVFDFVSAAAPIGSLVVDGFEKLLEMINAIPQDTLTVIVAAISGLAVGLTVLGAATAAYALGTAGAVIAAIAAYATAIGVLFTESETFRNTVTTVFNALKTAVIFAWEKVIKPTLAALGSFFKYIWETFLRPIIGFFVDRIKFLGEVFSDIYHLIIEPVVGYIVAIFKGYLFPLFKFLYEQVIKPTFDNIKVVFEVFKTILEVVMGVAQIVFKIIGAAVSAFYHAVVKPIFALLGAAFDWLADAFEKHVAPKVSKGLEVLGKVFDKLRDYARTPVRFIIETVLNNGLLKGYNYIAKKFGVTPDDVRIDLPASFHSGGILPGWSPGRDAHEFYSPTGGRLRLSGGEGIMRPELTRALGADWLSAGNAAARAGGVSGVSSWLSGGRTSRRRKRGTGDGFGDVLEKLKNKAKGVFEGITDFLTDPGGALGRLAEKLSDLVPNKDSDLVRMVTGIPRYFGKKIIDKATELFGKYLAGDSSVEGVMSDASELGGSGGMMAILRKVFPGLQLISGLRPGDRTSNGSLSYHGFNRAVDVPPRREVAIWINQHYGKKTRELITPWRDQDLWNGKPAQFSEALHNQHNFAGGNAHVHWAYDSGGIMPPGYGRWFNGTGKPEAVLTNEQWRNVATLVQHAEMSRLGSGNEYKFEFRDTTLTADRLRAIQDADATYQRINRAG